MIRIRRLAIGASASALAAPIAFAGILLLRSSEADAGGGSRRALTAATTLLLIASLSALALLPLSALSRHRRVARFWTLYYALIGMAGAVLVPLLAYYHLLGPWWL